MVYMNNFQNKLKVIVFNIVKYDESSFEDKWNKIIKNFSGWCNKLPAPLSPLAGKLEFLKRICECFKIIL